MSHSAQLIAAIRRAGRKGLTYLELELLRVSSSPWKRISESGHCHLRSGERLDKRVGRDGLKRFVIVKTA